MLEKDNKQEVCWIFDIAGSFNLSFDFAIFFH